jgi:hypothetical protein
MLVYIWSFPWHADWLVASVTLAVAVETRKEGRGLWGDERVCDD